MSEDGGLGRLDPSRDAERWERLVERVMEAAAPELERRAAPNPIAVVVGWLRPTLAVAVGLAALSLLALSRTPAPLEAVAVAGGAGVPEELGLPTPVADWLAEGREPSAQDLIVSLEQEIP